MPDVTWTHPALPKILDLIDIPVRSLLDVGCGRGIIGALCRIYREPTRLVGVDGHEPYLAFCRQRSFYDETYRVDVTTEALPFGDKEFEIATCIEVIEHVPKEAGIRLLTELDRVAWKVIVTTPNFFFEQREYDGNPFQKHLSRWYVGDFVRRGYRVHGVGGMKIMGREIPYLSPVLGKLTRPFPRLSTMLLGVKDSRAAQPSRST